MRRQSLELVTRFSSRDLTEETTGPPKFLENPDVRLHMFSRLRRDCGTRPLRRRSMALDVGKAKTPAIGLSELNSMAFGLAVYASPRGLPRFDPRLASNRWSDATGRASHPQGSYGRFQSDSLHLIPLPQALLGAITSTSRCPILFCKGP